MPFSGPLRYYSIFVLLSVTIYSPFRGTVSIGLKGWDSSVAKNQTKTEPNTNYISWNSPEIKKSILCLINGAFHFMKTLYFFHFIQRCL